MSTRKSGVLLHITSLPSPGGIGTLGREAYEFVDWLEKAGFGIWQTLPVGPTGFGESPYQSMCTHAGNTLMIDLRMLKEDGLLSDAESYLRDTADMEEIKRLKQRALRRSFRESFSRVCWDVYAFIEEHPHLDDYALFMAVRDYFNGKKWKDWPDNSIRMRDGAALTEYKRLLQENVDYYRYTQYLFFTQWRALRQYANGKGIELFGDMPIYVAEDSSDTWADPEIFQLDRDRRPVKVAGVPPDYFSEDGQLWGNPLYNWRTLRKQHFDWWIDRFRTMGELFDIVRVDHFIGFANYYTIKAGSVNARVGRWEKAPGFRLFRQVQKRLPELTVIAEDLGIVSKRVKRLLRYCGYPGMKVLCFGFDSDEANPHFPLNISENCVFYTGTHDNDTVRGWWEHASDRTKDFARGYLPERSQITDSMIEAVLGSIADRAIIPMQDILALDGSARMNTPGTVGGGNWRWRMSASPVLCERTDELREMNEFYERISK